MKVYSAEGIILKRINIGEADKILTVFTKQYGKKKYIAKGIRKITSRRGPQLELFNTSSFLVHKSNYYEIIGEAEIIAPFSSHETNLDQIKQAYECCEIIDILTRENQPHEEVYQLLVETLKKIYTRTSLDMVNFKVAVLTLLGFYSNRINDREIDSLIEEITEQRLHARLIYE